MRAYKVFQNKNGKLYSAGKLPKGVIFNYPKKKKGFIWPKIKNSKFFVFTEIEDARHFNVSGAVGDKTELWEIEVKQTFRPKGKTLWDKGRYSLADVISFWSGGEPDIATFFDGARVVNCLKLIKKVE